MRTLAIYRCTSYRTHPCERKSASFSRFAILQKKKKREGEKERKKNKLNLRIIKAHSLYSFQFFNRLCMEYFFAKQKSKSFGKLRIDSKRTFEEDLFLLKSFRKKKRLENVYFYH